MAAYTPQGTPPAEVEAALAPWRYRLTDHEWPTLLATVAALVAAEHPPTPPAEVEAALYAALDVYDAVDPGCDDMDAARAAVLATVAALVAAERERGADDLRRYSAEHVESECRKWRQSDRGGGYTWMPDEPCTCGLSDKLAIRQGLRP